MKASLSIFLAETCIVIYLLSKVFYNLSPIMTALLWGVSAVLGIIFSYATWMGIDYVVQKTFGTNPKNPRAPKLTKHEKFCKEIDADLQKLSDAKKTDVFFLFNHSNLEFNDALSLLEPTTGDGKFSKGRVMLDCFYKVLTLMLFGLFIVNPMVQPHLPAILSGRISVPTAPQKK